MPVFRPYSYFSSFLVLLELVMQLSKPLLEMEEKVGLSHLLPRGFQFSILPSVYQQGQGEIIPRTPWVKEKSGGSIYSLCTRCL